MYPTCEVDWCEKYPEHTIGIGKVAVGVCRGHLKETRKISRRHAIKMLEVIADIHDSFIDEVASIKKEEE